MGKQEAKLENICSHCGRELKRGGYGYAQRSLSGFVHINLLLCKPCYEAQIARDTREAARVRDELGGNKYKGGRPAKWRA